MFLPVSGKFVNLALGKRKHVVLSLETNLNVIRCLEKGESIKTVSKDLEVGKVTIGDWRRRRAELENWGAQN